LTGISSKVAIPKESSALACIFAGRKTRRMAHPEFSKFMRNEKRKEKSGKGG
jgi:hypothetical protein